MRRGNILYFVLIIGVIKIIIDIMFFKSMWVLDDLCVLEKYIVIFVIKKLVDDGYWLKWFLEMLF